MLPTSPLSLVSEKLARLNRVTSEIETELPSLRGLIPNLSDLADQITASEGKEATYALGTIKSGKSTLISALLGCDVLPRGSGVKTFNITRISYNPSPKARIAFKTAAQLAALIRFDLRMLGSLAETPADLFSATGIDSLRKIFDEFNLEAESDGRLLRINSISDDYNLLQISRTRFGHIVHGLERILKHYGASVLSNIAQQHELTFQDSAFEQYLNWANVIEYAALIQEIELSLPFPPTLSPLQVLFDCQGSDSLNPLDFAAVDAALHRADRVLYVVNSRLGLRVADKALVKHLSASGLADKTIFIHNVEAFEPLSRSELDSQIMRLSSDLASLGFKNTKPRALCAIYELTRFSAAEDHKLIQSLWERQHRGDVLATLDKEFKQLALNLNKMTQRDDDTSTIYVQHGMTSEDRRINLVARRLRKILEGILARDLNILGLQGSDLEFQEIKNAIEQLIDGERASLRVKLDQIAQQAYEKDAEIQQTINNFFAIKPAEYASKQPLPSSLMLASRHHEIMTTAREYFNTNWILIDQKIRIEIIHPLIQNAILHIRKSIEHLHKLVPSVIGAQLTQAGADVIPDLKQIMARVDIALDHFYARTDPPETLAPIVLPPHITSSLAAEFYARQWLDLLKDKIKFKSTNSKEKSSDESPTRTHNERKIKSLWFGTLKAAYKAAEQDQQFSVSSARENLKFLYFHRAIKQAFDAYKQALIDGVETYYREVDKLRSNHSLLLDGDDRRKLQEYLKRLEAELSVS